MDSATLASAVMAGTVLASAFLGGTTRDGASLEDSTLAGCSFFRRSTVLAHVSLAGAVLNFTDLA